MDLEEFYYSCSTSQKQKLAKLLIEDSLLDRISYRQLIQKNMLDEIYEKNMEILSSNRHRLSSEEETYINSLASKLKL